MFYLNNLNRTRETMINASAGFVESDFSQFCIYKVDVVEVDYEENTITVDHDGDEISDVIFVGHTDIDYAAYLDNGLTVPSNSNAYFTHAVYTLLREESVLFFKHSTDATKNFATQWIDQETGKDQFSNCPGTTYWGYAIFEFKVYDSGTYDERYYLIWDCDNDEPAKIVDDSGDLLTESDWPVHEDDLDDWLTDYRISTISTNSATATYSDRSLQHRVPSGGPGSITDCTYSTGTPSWTYSGSNYTGQCALGNTTSVISASSASENITNAATYNVCLGDTPVAFVFQQTGGSNGGKGTLNVSTIGLSFDYNHQLSASQTGSYDASGTFKAIFGEAELSWSASRSASVVDDWQGYSFAVDSVKYMHTQTLRKNALLVVTHTNTNMTGSPSPLTYTAYYSYTAATTDVTGEIPETNGALTTLLNSTLDTVIADNASYDVVLYSKTLRYAKYDSRIPLLEAA